MSYPTVYSEYKASVLAVVLLRRTTQIDHPYVIIIIIISVQFLRLFFFSKGLGHLRVSLSLLSLDG